RAHVGAGVARAPRERSTWRRAYLALRGDRSVTRPGRGRLSGAPHCSREPKQPFTPYHSPRAPGASPAGREAGHKTMEQPDSDTAWMNAGNCRSISPSVFFPSDGVGVEVARQICRDCPVKHPCLEYALVNHIDHGVWGGPSE